MAFKQYSSDLFIDLPHVICGGFCDVSGRMAYRLFCDSSDETNIKIRLDVTYFHIKAVTSAKTSGGGYFNGTSLSWFMGHYANMFNQGQYNLNNERNEDGTYKHAFDWPYLTYAKGSYVDQYPYPRTWWERACNDLNRVTYNSNPIFGITYADTIYYFGGKDLRYERYSSSIPSGDHDIVMWGDCFRDKGKFNGYNANSYPRVYVDGKTIHVSTSSCTRKSDGVRLDYESDLATASSNLSIDSPYSGNETSGDAAVCSITLSKAQMDAQGLIKYDPNFFKDKIDTNYDPYLFHGFVVPISWWARSRDSNGQSSLTLSSNRDAQQITLKMEEYTIPPATPPEPVKPLDDNTVYRLKSSLDSSGNKVVDKNGYVVLNWTKCERIGKE